METALDKAYEAYVARKQVERQLKLIQLREEILASMSQQNVPGRRASARKRTPLVVTPSYVAPGPQPSA